MAYRYVFADEAGNFDFSRNPGASRYFILTTVTMEDYGPGDKMLALRRAMGWAGLQLAGGPHASENPPMIRDMFYKLIMTLPLRVDATVLEKSKAQLHLQSDTALYRMGWWLHFKHVAPQIATAQDRLFVAAASLGTKKTRKVFNAQVDAVVLQESPSTKYRVAFWPALSDPCLWIADYCTWAVQRSWERGDQTALTQIGSKVFSNKDIWAIGTQHYY